MGLGFGATAFAMNQGEFQPETKRGLVSLLVALLLLAGLMYSGVQLVHLHLPSTT